MAVADGSRHRQHVAGQCKPSQRSVSLGPKGVEETRGIRGCIAK